LYDIIATPLLLYDCEILTLTQSRRLKTAKLKLMIPTAGYNLLDHRRNEYVVEELKVDQSKRN
jgi:hypothetical protein